MRFGRGTPADGIHTEARQCTWQFHLHIPTTGASQNTRTNIFLILSVGWPRSVISIGEVGDSEDRKYYDTRNWAELYRCDKDCEENYYHVKRLSFGRFSKKCCEINTRFRRTSACLTSRLSMIFCVPPIGRRTFLGVLSQKSIRHSLCFGVFCRGKQVGFAKVITDRATFAYLADVFIVPEHRGRGVGKMLIGRILAHRDLRGLRRIMLSTVDAHGLYAPFGFKPLTHPEWYLTIAFPGVYQKEQPRYEGP